MNELLKEARAWYHARVMAVTEPSVSEHVKRQMADMTADAVAQDLVAFHRHRTRWIKPEERMPDRGKDVLCLVQRNNLNPTDPVRIEQHTGHRMLSGESWIVGGHFSYDMGRIIGWQELPEGLQP